MKKSFLLLPLIACACPVLAEDAEVEKKPAPKPVEPLMRVVDRNGDGSLQQVEIDMAVAALRALDRDRDGTVSAEELAQAPAPAGGQPGAARRPDRPAAAGPGGAPAALDLSRLDANGDGKISKDEAPERLQERFDVIDGNGDGFLDKAEQDELVKRMRERFRQLGQPGQPNRPGFGAGQGGTTGGEKPKRPAPIE